MKTLSKLSILLILIVIISSCKKNNPEPDNNIYWKVNGVAKVAKPDASWYDDNTFMLEATSGKDYINLFIDSTFHTGTFRLDSPYYEALIEYQIGNGEPQFLERGTLTIRSSEGANAQGSFYGSIGTGASGINITEGSFNAKLHLYSTSDTSYYSDTLFNVMKIKRLALTNRKTGRTP
ncbi:MAG: hypothetical protein JST50_01310 [Bacteroidetes bacterium]|nr:hypothetical protein [Bacteroidota bacterium]